MKQNIFLSIVIPAYNEKENFHKGALTQVDNYLKKQKYLWEVIVVDDGSKDDTVKLVTGFIKGKKNWHLLKNSHQGKAAAVIAGVMKARGEGILFTDFDQATPIGQSEKLIPRLKEGFDIVIGSREVKGAKREKEPFYRHLMGKGFNILVKVMLLGGIQDTQCGFKLFTVRVKQTIFPKIKVYKPRQVADAYTGAFDVEILFLAKKYGLKVAEMPVIWHHVKTIRVNPIKDSLRMFYDIMKIRFYDFLGKYES